MWNANSRIRKRQGNDLSEGRNGEGVPILARGHGEVRTDFGYDNPARARAFFMHLTCIYAHLNHVKECIYNAGKCIVNVMRLRREARVCGGLIAFVHSTCNARECA